MRFSFRRWETLNLSIQQGTGTWSRNLLQLATTASGATSDESFRTYIPAEILLKPGEFRVSLPGAGSTPSTIGPVAFARIGGAMTAGLNTRGGVWMSLPNASGAPLSATATSTTVRLMQSGVFETRVMLLPGPATTSSRTRSIPPANSTPS
jgi:hypothetical protein